MVASQDGWKIGAFIKWLCGEREPEPSYVCQPAAPGVVPWLIWNGLKRVSYGNYARSQEFMGVQPVSILEFRRQLETFRNTYLETRGVSNVVSIASHSVSREFRNSQWDRGTVVNWIVNQQKLDGKFPSYTETRNEFPGLCQSSASKWRRLAINAVREDRKMAA